MDSRDILKVVATRFIGNLVYVRCVGKGEELSFLFILNILVSLYEMEKTIREAHFEGKIRVLI